MGTKKLYYEFPFKTKCSAKIVKIVDNRLILDQTIAFPEGGGQVGDAGTIVNEKNGKSSNFLDTRKLLGRQIYLDDFPVISVEEEISHIIPEENLEIFSVGDSVEVNLDVKRRAGATIHHSALHLGLYVLEMIRPGIDKKIVGAKINDSYGRLDFSTSDKFSREE